MKRIFISYKRANRDKVLPLVNKIEKHLGVKCWIDAKGIKSNAQFISVICNAIDEADVVLFMHSSVHLSIDFNKDWTIKELRYAHEKKKNVALIKLDDSPLENLFLFEYGSLNNTNPYDQLQFDQLLTTLRSWLNLPTESSVTHSESNVVNLKVLSNIDCNVMLDGEDKGVARANILMKIPLPAGEYIVQFTSTENLSDSISREILLTYDKIEKVDLLTIQQNRKKNEEAESYNLEPYISNGRVGYANKHTQEIVIPCKYDFAYSFSEGLACVKLNGRYGYIDKNGKEVIECKYDYAGTFKEGLALVGHNCAYGNALYGYIDKNGTEVIPCKYIQAHNFNEGRAAVCHNQMYGYIDNTGKQITPFRYQFADSFYEGLACIQLDDKYGYIDKNGKEIIPCIYEFANSFCEGLACVQLDGKYRYIDREGKETIPHTYEYANSFCEGLAYVRQNGKYGYIDKNGKEIIPCIYEDVGSFCEGLAYVKLEGHYGYIDRSGKEVIPSIYTYADSFEKGMAIVCINDLWGRIDKNGKTITPYKYLEFESYGESLSRISTHDSTGYVDIFGNEILMPISNDGHLLISINSLDLANKMAERFIRLESETMRKDLS